MMPYRKYPVWVLQKGLAVPQTRDPLGEPLGARIITTRVGCEILVDQLGEGEFGAHANLPAWWLTRKLTRLSKVENAPRNAM